MKAYRARKRTRTKEAASDAKVGEEGRAVKEMTQARPGANRGVVDDGAPNAESRVPQCITRNASPSG